MDVGQLNSTDRSIRNYAYEDLTYLHRFMADHINYYLFNIETALKTLELAAAYQLTK